MFLHLLMSSSFVNTFKSITYQRRCDRCVFVKVHVCGWESVSAHVHLAKVATLHRSDRHQPSPSVTDMQLKIHSLSSTPPPPSFTSIFIFFEFWFKEDFLNMSCIKGWRVCEPRLERHWNDFIWMPPVWSSYLWLLLSQSLQKTSLWKRKIDDEFTKDIQWHSYSALQRED